MPERLLFPERLRLAQDSLSRGQLRVARYLLSQPRQASHLAAVRIGQTVGVSESTVVRLALRLGYDGFPQMQDDIARSLAPDGIDDPRRSSARTRMIERALDAEMRNLEQTLEALDLAVVAEAVDLLQRAQTIYVVGFRTSFSLAYLASFLIRQTHPATVLLDDAGGTLPDDLAAMTERDVLIAVSFPRYVRRTVQAVEYARSRGVRTIAITDSFLSPISRADILVPVQHFSPSFFNSNVAATAIIDAIAAELADRIGPASSAERRALVEAFYETAEDPGAFRADTSQAPRDGPGRARRGRTS
jgi:DNA-binding MurR/RpiR family transcriptional regulator